MIYEFQNVKLTIDGANLFVQDGTLSNVAQITTDRIHFDNSINYNAEGGINGVLQFSYLCTGTDSLYNAINEKTPVSGYFAGFYFDEGYVSNHSVNIQNNSIVSVNASMNFYKELQGEFRKENVSLSSDIDVGHADKGSFSDLTTVMNLSNGVEASGFLGSVALSTTADVKPTYVVDEEEPYNVTINEIRKTFNLNGVYLGPSISWTGAHSAVDINVRDQSENLLQRYSTTGVITSRDFSVGNGEIIKGSVSMFEVR